MQGEVEPCFRRDFHLLAVGKGLNSRAAGRACACADGRAFTTSREAADDGAENGTSTDDFRGALATRAAFFLNVAAGDLIRPALIGEAVERNSELAAALEFSGGAGVHDLQIYIQAFGNDDAVADNDRRVERAAKRLAGTRDAGVYGIDSSHGDNGAFGNRNRDGLRRRWRRRRRGSGWLFGGRVMQRTRAGIGSWSRRRSGY